MVAGNGSSKLQTPYIFSYMRRGGGGGGTKKAEAAAASEPEAGSAASTAAAVPGPQATTPQPPHPYENSIKTITQVETVEGFWETYDFLKRPNDLPTTTDYHFFRGGEVPIKPTWEDVRTSVC